MSPPEPIVSLIVPIRNEEPFIAACLSSIREQTYPANLLEIMVVDGESSDETVRIVQEQAGRDSRIQLLSNPARSMPAGLNLGIQHARGIYVGQVSGHSVLPPGYVASAVEAIERTGAWSVGGRIVRAASSPMQRAIAIATSSPIGVGDSTHNYAAEAGWVDTVFPGFWRREIFDKIGYFDPGMIVNEDNEFSLRIREAGGRIWYEPSIPVEYVPRASLGALFQQYRRYALGKMRVLRKHHGGLRLRNFVPAAWVVWLFGGAALALLFPGWALAWLLGIAAYCAVIVLASLRLSDAETSWWQVAAALMTIHLAYGIGIWHGLATWWAGTPRP